MVTAEPAVPLPPVRVAPLLPIALAVSVGIATDRYTEPWGTATWAIIALAVACLTALSLWISHRQGRREGRGLAGTLALFVAWVAIGGAWHHHCWSDLTADDLALRMPERDSNVPRPVWVRGVLQEVVSVPAGKDPGDEAWMRAVLDVSGLCDGRHWQKASGRVQLIVAGEPVDLAAGEPVEAAGRLAPIAAPLNPGEFDRRSFLRAQGIRLRMTVHAPQGIWHDPAGSPWPPARWLAAVRSWSYGRLVQGLDPAMAPLAAALLLGRREAVDPDVNDAFARTGTTHLLAISGLQLQVMAGVLWLVFRVLGLSRRGAFGAVGLATVAYALLVGLMPSVVRSAAMTVAFCVAGMRNRATRPANILALAALVTLALNPAYLFDVGCQLSFLAVGAIVWGVRPAYDSLHASFHRVRERLQGPSSPLDELERRFEARWRTVSRRCARVFVQGVVLSTVVWLAALPLVALRFHVVSPIGVALNVPLVPLTSLALLAAGLTLALSSIWTPLGWPAAWACGGMLAWSQRLVLWGSAQRWGQTFVAGPSWVWVVGFYGLLGLGTAALAGRWRERPKHWAGIALVGWVALGGIVALLPSHPAALEAEVLAVGHGLAVVIRPGDGRTILYDCGRLGDSSVGRRVIAPALWTRGVSRIDSVILSHADADHFDGLPDLLDRFAVGEVRVAPGFDDGSGGRNPAATRLLAAVRARGIPVLPIAAGDRWPSASARLSVLHPPRRWSPALVSDDNARSVVLDLEANGRHVLLTGDLEHDGLVELVQRVRPESGLDVLLAPHHGGRSANPDWLYHWAQPRLVVVSQRSLAAGTADALAPVEAGRVPVLRTWQRGAVRLCWSENGVVARGFLDGPASHRGSRETQFATRPLVLAALWPRGLVAVAGFVLGAIVCGALAVREWGAWTLIAPARRLGRGPRGCGDPDQARGEPLEMVAADGVRLAGVWYRGGGAEASVRGRTVLMLHGWGEDPSALLGRIEALTRHGWNVAMLDPRGYGRSGGEHATFGGREADDLRAWANVMAARVGPSLTLAAWGRSMGAGIIVRAAAADPRFRALVLESPYVDLEETIVVMLRRLRLPAPRWLTRLIVDRAEALTGVSLTRPRPIDVVPCVAAPTLIVHGANDGLVPLADARKLADAFPRPAALIEVPGARHSNVVDVGGPELLDRIADFFNGTVPAEQPATADRRD